MTIWHGEQRRSKDQLRLLSNHDCLRYSCICHKTCGKRSAFNDRFMISRFAKRTRVNVRHYDLSSSEEYQVAVTHIHECSLQLSSHHSLQSKHSKHRFSPNLPLVWVGFGLVWFGLALALDDFFPATGSTLFRIVIVTARRYKMRTRFDAFS